MKRDKQCLGNKCQDVFSARMLSHEPLGRSPPPPQTTELVRLGPCQHVAAFRQGEGGITLIHFEACLPLLSRTGWVLKEGAEMLVHPFRQSSDYFLAGKNDTDYGKLEEFNVDVSKTQRKIVAEPFVASYHGQEMTLYFTSLTKCRDIGQNSL